MLFLLSSWMMLLLKNQVLINISLIRSHLMLRSISWLPHLCIHNIHSIALLRIANRGSIPSQIRALNLLTRPIRIGYLLICIRHLRPYLLYLLSIIPLEEVHLRIRTTSSLFEIKHIRWLLNMVILVMDITWGLGSYVLALSHFVFSRISCSDVVLILVQAGFWDDSIVVIIWGLLCVLLSSGVRVVNDAVLKEIVRTCSVVHVLFSGICVCVILEVYVIVHIIGHVTCWLFNLIFRSTLRCMSFAIYVLRIHNSIRMSSLIRVIDLPWLRLIHLTTSRPCRTRMKSSNTTRSSINLFIFTLITTSIPNSNNILSIT